MKKEEQYIVLAIATVNASLCLIVFVRAVRVCVPIFAGSPLAKKEEQYIVLTIATVNAILCLIVLAQAVHVCVGLISFVSVAMMLIGTSSFKQILSCFICMVYSQMQRKNLVSGKVSVVLRSVESVGCRKRDLFFFLFA